MISDWRAWPFNEIWCVDTEFFPGLGFSHGGREGDLATPLCLCAVEMRTGAVVKLWREDLAPQPPFDLSERSLFVAYSAAAEFGCFRALGWPKPARSLDPSIEFRRYVNNAAVKSEERAKGFYSLDGALRWFTGDGLDIAHKHDMRERILTGGPFTEDEKAAILDYCLDDARAVARLLPYIAQTIENLPQAHYRASFQWAVACQERRGVPLDLPTLETLRTRWGGLRARLVEELDGPFGCFETEDGEPHFRERLFSSFIARAGLAWPKLASGAYDTSQEAFSDMVAVYPALQPLQELRASLAQLRLNSLAVGRDGRNRTQLWAYSTKTGRNAPRSSRFIFGPAKWLRFLITPPEGLALAHRDFCQQEVVIAAVMSEDAELLAAVESGDVYMSVAKQLGLAPEDSTAESHADVRGLMKTVVLGLNYGLGAKSLADRVNLSPFEAYEILARLRARFRRFEEFMAARADVAGLTMSMSTQFGWRMLTPPGTNARLIRNFPMQSTGAEILHVASILAEERGVRIVAPVHDAFMVEAKADEIDEASDNLDRVMRDASKMVLGGYELRTDVQIIRPGERYFDKRGKAMWGTVNKILAESAT